MDPQSSEHSGMNLPPAINNQQPASEAIPAIKQELPEAVPLAGPIDPTNTQAPIQSIPPIQLPIPAHTPQNSTPADVSTTTQTVVPGLADDTDLIEKEWVDKAKQIVERNKEDPYEQSKELTIFKADYMKKRYNRTIKLGE